MKQATIKDVAKLAEVSPVTVSNVINNNTGRFSEATRTRVLNAMEKLNYQPNRAAQFMRKGQIGVLALSIPTINNPYFSELAREIIREADKRGYSVLIAHTEGDPEDQLHLQQERLLVIASGPHSVDGVILDPRALSESDLHPSKVGIPIVTIGERLTGKYHDHVMIDNVAAARTVTEHLIQIGRQRIAILPVPLGERSMLSHLRYQGYRDALEAANISLDPQLVVKQSSDRLDFQVGMTGIDYLLDLRQPPDAVFCINDHTALGAIKRLLQRGFRVPDDIAVVGIDNIEAGYLMTPGLTTISPDKEAIGNLVVSLLIDRIAGSRSGPPEVFMPNFELIVRESTIGYENLFDC